MILPEEYFFLNEADNSSYKPISILNSEKNQRISVSPQYQNQCQLIEQRVETDSIESLKFNTKSNSHEKKQQRNLPLRQMNNFTNHDLSAIQPQSNKQLESEQQSPQKEGFQGQKLGDLSMISFDSQEEINNMRKDGDNVMLRSQGNYSARKKESDFAFFQNQNNFVVEGEDDLISSGGNYDTFYQSNGFSNKKKKKRKQSEQRREAMQKKFDTIHKIYSKDLASTSTSGWFQAHPVSSSSKQIQEIGNNLGNNTAKSSRAYQHQQKPYSAQISNSNLKYTTFSNGFQNVPDIPQKPKMQATQQGRLKEQKSTEMINSNTVVIPKLKPPQSANLTYKSGQKAKNYKEMIINRPQTKQGDLQLQTFSNNPSAYSQTPKRIFKNQQFMNIQNENNFIQDDFPDQGSSDGGFSFQNVFQLARDKDSMISPRSNTQDLNRDDHRENDFDQMLSDHHIYVASTVSNQNSNTTAITNKNENEEKKVHLYGKTLASLQRPLSKENTSRKDASKNGFQNGKPAKKEELQGDNSNKVVSKNKKRTIFNIKSSNNQALSNQSKTQQGGGCPIQQKNSVQSSNNDELFKDSTYNQVTLEPISPLVMRNSLEMIETCLLSVERETSTNQKENLPSVKITKQESSQSQNATATPAAKKNANILNQDQTQLSTISNFSNQNSRITSLQATVAANRTLNIPNNKPVVQKPKSSTSTKQTEDNGQSQQINQNPIISSNQLDTSDSKPKKKSKINSNTNFSATVGANMFQNANQVNTMQRVFCMNSQDEYIRRTLLRMGWRENKIPQSTTFDLKWIYIDSNDDYKLLNDYQYYNHFKNNTELTQKGRLLFNLKNNTQFGVNQESFFPRCYDLGNDQERQEFNIEFNRTNVLIVLKNHISYMKLRRAEIYKQIKKAYQIKQNNKLNSQVKNGVEFKKGAKTKLINPLIYEDSKLDSKFIVNVIVIADAIEMLRKIKKQQEEYIDETRKSKEFNQQYSNQNSQYKLHLLMQQYAKINVPFDEEKQVFEKFSGMGKEHWSTPSLKLMTKLYSLYKFFKGADPQFKVSGTKNIWIIKPSANSRGSGIYLVDKVEEAIDSGMKMQARIVQKYIERPLIFQGEKFKKLNNKKFDIRQWVLVTSFKPLKIYFFTSSYLRICSQTFDLDNIKNLSKHLTNFSINKNNVIKENWDETVVELREFIGYLKEYKGIDYQEEVKPQMKGLIIETIKCAADKIVHRKNNFELYGFDILLDEEARPWLLEVNLSPACSERTPFLTDMLDAMAYKMFQIVLKLNETTSNKSLEDQEAALKDDPSAPQSCKNPDYEWEEIYNEEENDDFRNDENGPSLAFNNDLQLVVIGQKADLKKERNLDKKYFQFWGAIKIQSQVRQFLAKKKLIHLRKTKYSIIIQKNIRMHQAQKKLKFLRQTKASIQIQSLWRRKKCMDKLILLKKNKLITKMQVLYKIRKAKEKLHELKLNKCSTKIQCKYRQFKAKQLLKSKKYFKACAITIQKFYKKRFGIKMKSATKLKTFFKMKKSVKQYQIMKKRHYAALKIQTNYKRHRAQQLKDKIRMCRIVSKIYFKSKKILLNELTQKVRIYPFAKTFTQILHKKLKLVCLRKIYNIGLIRVKAAIRIQGLLKIKKAKRYKKRMYRLRLLIKLQRRVKAYLQRLKFLRYFDRKKAAGVKIAYFLKRCVAKSKLETLKYNQMQKKLKIASNLENTTDFLNWAQKTNNIQNTRPSTQQNQNKSRSKIQRPPSQFENRNISTSSSNRRESYLQKGSSSSQVQQEMMQTKSSGGFNYFNYLKDTQSRQNQVKATSLLRQNTQLQQQQSNLQTQINPLMRNNSQNMVYLKDKQSVVSDEYNLDQIIKNYAYQNEDSPPRNSQHAQQQNNNGMVGSSKSSYNIKYVGNTYSKSQSQQQQQQLHQQSKHNFSTTQDSFNKTTRNNSQANENLKKYKLNQEIIKDIERNMTKVIGQIKPSNSSNNSHQMSSTMTNFLKF